MEKPEILIAFAESVFIHVLNRRGFDTVKRDDLEVDAVDRHCIEKSPVINKVKTLRQMPKMSESKNIFKV